MTTPEAIEILNRHNRWRRGDDDIEPTDPKQLGLAIERAIAVMEAAKTLSAAKGRHNTTIAYKAMESAMEGNK
jgi:hypothetical protein